MPRPTPTAEYVRSILDYDPETGDHRWKVDRRGTKAGAVAGSIHSKGYRSIRIDGKSFLAHRLAWLIVMGEWPKDQIDHRNHKPDDNRWCNLREATQTQNQQHARSLKKGIVFKGVRRCNTFTWSARIVVNKREIYLGTFDTAEEAANAYNKAALKYFGEFAHVNKLE